jgi:adenylylsulfate kinase-like enzyme
MTGYTLATGRAATLIKLAFVLKKRLNAIGKHAYLMDGDHLRQGLNRYLSRTEYIRRVVEVAKLFVVAGLIVIVALISSFRAGRLVV